MCTSSVLVSPSSRSPHPVDEHVAGEHPSGVLDQQPEQLELLATQVDLVAADEGPPGVGLEAEAAELLDAVVPAGRLRPSSACGERRSTARIRATSSRMR